MRKLFILIVIILIIGGYFIKTSYDLDAKNPEDRKTFISVFSKWVLKLGRNIASLTSSAVKQDWSPVEKNDTKTTN